MTRRIGSWTGRLIIVVASAVISAGAYASGSVDPDAQSAQEGSPFDALCHDARQGDAKAQYVLGCCYNGDHGIRREPAKAAEWWEKAATQGIAEAQYCLGLSYYMGEGVPRDTAAAAKWWRKAADQDHADAEYFLGVSYEAGVGVPKCTALAVHWLRKSASQGNTQAAGLLKRIGSPAQLAAN
jgi:TPR repeat protein